MQQKKLEQLEKQTGENKDQINTLKIGFENFKSLFAKIDGMVDGINNLTIEMAKNTISHNENSKTSLILTRKVDKLQDQIATNTNELAALKPFAGEVVYYRKAIIASAFGTFALAASVMGYVISTNA